MRLQPQEAQEASVFIRSVRRTADMTQEEFAHAIGVTFSTISRIENEHSEVSTWTLQAIFAFMARMRLVVPGSQISNEAPWLPLDTPMPTTGLRREETATVIKQFREKNGMTQEQLAQKLLTTFSTVNRWENGHVGMSRIALWHLQRLAASMKVELACNEAA